MNSQGPFSLHQNEIYAQGMGGVVPSLPLAYEDLEIAALDAIPEENHFYISGGAGGEQTMQANLAAFDDVRILPRMMRDISTRDLSVELIGHSLHSPLLLAPVGVQVLAHEEGELATARACKNTGVPYIHSSAASTSLEDAARELGDTPRWFQLYWPNDHQVTKSFCARAEAAGYSAIVVTLDTKMMAWRERDLEKAFLPFLKGVGLANYFSDPAFCAPLAKPPHKDLMAAVQRWGTIYSDLTHTWKDIALLRAATSLPLVLKGIMHPDDARTAVEHGVEGIVVSNHGGRQVDGGMAALDALPEIVAAVGEDTTVLFDSGIRRGADAFKALALGARAVLLGRPYLWGLALGGQAGVEEITRRFLAELDITMALSGYTSLAELTPDALVDG